MVGILLAAVLAALTFAICMARTGETPFDRSAHLRMHDGIGDVLPAIVKRTYS